MTPIELYAHKLTRVVMTAKAKVTHFAQLDSATRTICGRERPASSPLIVVDSLDPRETCDHCRRAEYDARFGDAGNRVAETRDRVAQRKIDNGVAWR